MNKSSAARMVNGKIVVYNPNITSVSEFTAGNAKLAEQKLAAAQKAGKVSVVSQQDFARGLSPTTPPASTAPKTSKKPTKKLKGKADDDSAKKKKSEIKVRTEADPALSSGRRLKNPLGALSSYTYQLSLYMVTPDALDMFIDGGGKSLGGFTNSIANGPMVSNDVVSAGAYLVAQSGGVNKEFEQRAPSFGLDYGIDNLSFTIGGPKENGSATAQFDFKFRITEPFGFSFISNLKRAADAIKDYSTKVGKKQKAANKRRTDEANKNRKNKKKTTVQSNASTGGAVSGKSPTGKEVSTPSNPTKNFFILGIRFFGYNASGKLVRGTDTTAATNSFGGVTGGKQEIDPGNSSYALFERFYPISINKMKTKVDGRATTYDIEATSYNIAALGTKRGIVNNEVKLTAATVGEALDQLMAKLNKEQKNISPDGYTYDIKYATPKDAARIRNSKIVSKADLDKYKWPGSGAKNTKESNTSTENKKGNKPKNNSRDITINKGTPILQAINQIIAQSSFLEDALKTVFTTALEPDQDKKDLPALDNSGKKTIEWYHCTPDISSPTWDENTADWVYDIDYILNIYDTPVLDTAYTNPSKKYYGAAKRYEYWYSGTNSEVIKYEQQVDNNFYNTFLGDAFGKDKDKKDANKKGGTNTKNASNGSGNASGVTTPLVQNQKTGQPTQGKQGLAMEAQNSYMTSLFDPGATATAKVTILGDPDWLMSSTPARGGNESTVYSKFYGSDGFSVNPSGGQVFFEIDFKEAIDYKSDGRNMGTKDGSGITGAPGTMSLNSSILFWKDPKSISKLVKGISYGLTKCTCTFSNGSFTQVLEGVINTFGDAGSNDDGKAREPKKKSKGNSGPNKGNSTATTTKKGLKPADTEAWKRYSTDKTIRTQAWAKKQAQDQATTDRLNAGIPPLLRKKNKPET